MRCNSEGYESDESHEIDIVDRKKYRALIKKCKNNENLAYEEYYDYVQPYFRWKIKNHKLIYFVFKPMLCFLHFNIIRDIILRGNCVALIAFLFETAVVFLTAFYFSLQIGLFVSIGCGLFYTLIYCFKKIFRYYDYDTEKSNFNSEKIQIAYEEIQLTTEEKQYLEKGRIQEQEKIYARDYKQKNGNGYIINFIKTNYIALIAYLFESAAIVFTTFYFSLQISLFVFTGFSLFYVLICVARKIVNYCVESKISTDTKFGDNNGNTKSINFNEEERPLSENNLQKDKN